MGLNFKMNYKKFKLITLKLIKLNKLSDGYIRPIVFRSSNSMSPDTENVKQFLLCLVGSGQNYLIKREVYL